MRVGAGNILGSLLGVTITEEATGDEVREPVFGDKLVGTSIFCVGVAFAGLSEGAGVDAWIGEQAISTATRKLAPKPARLEVLFMRYSLLN